MINIFPAPMCPKSTALLPDLRPSGSLTWVQFQLCSVSFHQIRRQWTVIGEKSCLMKTVLVKLFCTADHNPASCRILCSAIQKIVFLCSVLSSALQGSDPNSYYLQSAFQYLSLFVHRFHCRVQLCFFLPWFHRVLSSTRFQVHLIPCFPCLIRLILKK